jgi:hypothetical protein
MLEANMNTDFKMVVGTVGYVSIKEMTEEEKLRVPFDNDFTHKCSLSIQGLNKSGDPKAEKDSIWFSLGNLNRDELTAKDESGNWHPVAKGCEIKFQYKDSKGNNGATFYNVKRSQVTLTKVVEQAQPKAQQSAGTGKKFDNTGIKVGHLQNCTENWLGSEAFNDKEIYRETAQMFDQLTKEVAGIVRVSNPNFSDFDVDVTAGRAVLSASRNVVDGNMKGDFETVKQFAISGASDAVRDVVMDIVTNTNPKKDLEKQQEQQEKIEKSQPKPKPAQAKTPEPEVDFDDDIPF